VRSIFTFAPEWMRSDMSHKSNFNDVPEALRRESAWQNYLYCSKAQIEAE